MVSRVEAMIRRGALVPATPVDAATTLGSPGSASGDGGRELASSVSSTPLQKEWSPHRSGAHSAPHAVHACLVGSLGTCGHDDLLGYTPKRHASGSGSLPRWQLIAKELRRRGVSSEIRRAQDCTLGSAREVRV